MAPSAAAAPRSDDDNEDHVRASSNQTTPVISDSDMDIDNNDDNEIEEDPEEEVEDGDNDDVEQDIEAEVEEEEQIGERWNDNHQHAESDKQPGSDSTHELSELRKDIIGNIKCSHPSDKPLTIQEGSYVKYADCRSPRLNKHLVAQENGTLELAVNKTDMPLSIKKNPEECDEANGYSKVQLSSSEAIDASTTDPSVIKGMEVDVLLSKRHCLGEKANVVLDSKGELKLVGIESGNRKEQIASRLVPSRRRARSSSPATELRDGSKRSAVICDFFAKGWCIRGSSCRFLHITNKAENTNQQPGDEVGEREDQFDEGVRNVSITPTFTHFPDPVTSTPKEGMLSSHFSLEGIPPQEHKENQRLHQLDGKHKFKSLPTDDFSWGIPPDAKQFPSSKGDPGFSSSFKDLGLENLRQNWPAADYGSICTSQISRGSPFSFNSSSEPSLLRSQKLLDGDCASRSSSLLGSASVFSGSKTEKLSLVGVPGDQLHHWEHKVKISSNDWEPSVPFRPSFFITPEMISSSGSQYDPLRDSFDLPNIGDKSFKFSFFSQGTPISNTSQQLIDGDSLLSRTFGTECNGDKSAASFHSGLHGSLLNKNCSTPGKDSFTIAMVTGGTGAANSENGIAPKEESASGTDYDKVSQSTKKIDVHDARHQMDRPRHKKDFKADGVGQNNEMEVDQKIDGDVQKEPKVLRHFRSALIDFVKELLKPTWRAGRLSKDTHNKIVRKTVEKVLSTLQLHQVPVTMESIKQFLSSSQPKMTKLVEGYVTKYGKS